MVDEENDAISQMNNLSRSTPCDGGDGEQRQQCIHTSDKPSADAAVTSATTARSSPRLKTRSSPRVAPASSSKTPPSQRKKTPKKSSRKHGVVLLRTAEKEEASLVTLVQTDVSSTYTASPTKKQAVELITAAQINYTARKLFGEDCRVLDRPCVSARLFACYVLFSDQHKKLSNFVPGKCSATKKNGNDDTCDSLQPILAFLRAMVRVEAVSLGSLEGTATGDENPERRRKLVHFSAFDGSSTKPPVDREIGSGSHQQQAIDAMVTAKEQIHALTQPAILCIQDLLAFLTNHLSDTVLSECAAAVAENYPPKRVRALADQYRKDLSLLGRRLLELPPQVKEAGGCELEPLSVEQCLAALVGQCIRFRLRMFFNGAPPRLCKQDDDYENRSAVYSKVSALVAMTMTDAESERGGSGAKVSMAVLDAAISALISQALCRLYEFFGLESMLDSSEPELPETFCASEASQRQLSTRAKSVIEPLTDEQCSAVLRDIREATAFLAAARAARFLVDLWTAPGVQEEVQRMGGWSEVETYASVSWKYDLRKLCPADAHLVALCNFDSLLRRLDNYCVAMEDLVDPCEAALRVVHKNYHLGKGSKAVLGKYPQIAEIASVYDDAMERAQAFPLVQSVDDE